MKSLGTFRVLIVLHGMMGLLFFGRAFAKQSDSEPSKGEEDLFEIRKFDEVYFKSGDIVRGTLAETDVKGELKIKDTKRNTTRNFLESETTKILRAQSPDSAFKQLSKECVGNPVRALKIAKAAKARFNSLNDQIVVLLERESLSRDPEVLAYLCELYLEKGKNTEALKTAETLVSASSSKGRSFLMRGLAHLALNNTAAAEKDFDQAQKLAPEDSEVLVARANLLLSTGRAAEARNVFTDTLKKNSNNVAALTGQGLVQLRQGETLDAEKSFEKALSVNSDHHPAKVGLAYAKILNKHADDAYVLGERLLSNNPKDADAYAIKSFAKFYNGDKASLDAFDKELKEAFKERPNQPRLLWAWVASLERRAKIEEASGAKDSATNAKSMRDLATQKLNELEQMNVSDAAIQFFLAERKFRSGDYAGAQKNFLRVVALAPAYASAHAALASTYLKSDNFQAASDSYTKAAQLDNSKGEYLAGKGLALLKLQHFEQAEDLFKKALDMDAKNVTARCGLGYVKNFTKNKTAAVEFFQQALAVDGNCAYAADALSKIYRQDDLALEYVTFEDDAQTANWKPKGSALQSQVVGGKLVFSGTQGSSTGSKVEYFKEIKADEFTRIEADFTMSSSSPVTFGLRIGGAGSSNFDLEVGKDDSNEIKVRYRDLQTPTPLWTTLLNAKWPVEGRVRLGIDTEDLKIGKCRIFVNGVKKADVNLILQRPGRITAGVFVQAPAKETVVASVDNLVLVTRLAPGVTVESGDGLKLTQEDKKPEDKKTDDKKSTDKKDDF